MENPATWNEATKVIQDAITKFYKACDEGICGASIARTIHDELERNNLLVTSEMQEKIDKINGFLDSITGRN